MNRPDVIAAKIKRLIDGERVVCSDADYDTIIRDLPDPYNARLASLPNPEQVGTLDRWVAFVKPAQLWCPECGERARRAAIKREGWALRVDAERLQTTHLDGEPLCPVMTAKGYQPALPTEAQPAG